MSIPQTTLDFSVKGLFPSVPNAETNPKCQTVAKVVQAIAQRCDMSQVKQEDVCANANSRLDYVSKQKRLHLYQVDHAAYTLYQKYGVSPELAKEYYSYRLTEADAKKWTICLV